MVQLTQSQPCWNTSNPYSGLNSLDSNQWSLHGRDKEVNTLVDLLISNRIILLHSRSGAGKSSLISSGVLPKLQELGRFHTLPIIRLNENLQALGQHYSDEGRFNEFDENKWNRFSWSMLRALDSVNPQPYPLKTLAKIKVYDYFENTHSINNNQAPKLLIFENFEDILIKSPNNIEEKELFFRELGIALRNKSLWAIFVIQEKYLSTLQSYYNFLSNSVPLEYRVEFLEEDSAREAILNPAKKHNVLFKEDALDKLISQLLSYKKFSLSGKIKTHKGKWIDPLQLQLECHLLWDKLEPETKVISTELIPDEIFPIDTRLSHYYATTLEEIYPKNLKRQHWARKWIEKVLISKETSKRRLVDLGGKLSKCQQLMELMQGLKEKSIIHRFRPNTQTFELSHERMIKPILENNAQWFRAN